MNRRKVKRVELSVANLHVRMMMGNSRELADVWKEGNVETVEVYS